MKKVTCIILAAVMILGLLPMAALAASPIRVTVDGSDLSPFGAFEGWGTSLCWWAETLGDLPEAERLTLSKAIFDPVEGLGLNIVRYNVGAGDAPGHTHQTGNPNDLRGLPVWVDEDGSFNPDADPKQIAFLKDAVSMGADNVELFANSPPYYLTVSGCSSGGKDGNENNIQPENFGKFAEYLATVAAYINNDLGIKVNTVEPFNEPVTNFWTYEGSQEGCHIDAKDHSALILAVHNALRAKGLNDTYVAAADENNSDNMAGYLSQYTDEALAVMPRLNVHSYGGSGYGIRSKAQELGKKLYQTEDDWAASIGYDAGAMGPALWLSQKITDDMRAMRPNAWIYWQITGTGADNDSGYWNACSYDRENHRLNLFKKYYAFAQYTKFIRPGDQFIMADRSNVTAVRNYVNGKTVLVVTNSGKRDEEYEIDLSSLQNLGTKLSVYRTDNEKNLELMTEGAVLDGKVLRADVPKDTINTYVIENETPTGVGSLGLTLDTQFTSCLEGDKVLLTANVPGGEQVVFSARGGSVGQNGVFTATEPGRATVTAAIEGTDMSASRTIDVIQNGDVVRIVSAYSGLAVKEQGDGYVQAGDDDSAYQYWQIKFDSGLSKSFTFTNLRSGRQLADGDCVHWKVVPEENGGYALVNIATGKALDVYGNSRDEGTTVGTYDLSGDQNQCWNMILGRLRQSVDTLSDGNSNTRLVPVSIDGTAAYGGSEEVDYTKAFDGDVTTHHDAWDGSNSYLVANMPQDKPVTLIRFYPREGFDWRMYGGKFYGVKDGQETLLYTVPDKLKREWNEAYIQNDVIYDSIIYRTPEWGLCNVAELEYYNVPFDADMWYYGGIKLNIDSYTDAADLQLVVRYYRDGQFQKEEVDSIPVGKYENKFYYRTMDGNYEYAEVYLKYGDSVVTSGYVYLWARN